MTDCVRIDLHGVVAQIWAGQAKSDLADENGPLFPEAFIASLVEVESESVAIGDLWDGTAFHRPTPPSPRIDGAAFLARVHDGEYAAVTTAAQSSIQLARWLDQLRILGYVDLGSEAAIAAKAYLIANGLLTETRAGEIFAAP